jgi:hypothetical protein
MTEYTIDLNGSRYKLNEEFRAAIAERARNAYEKNDVFSCWWSVAKKENYTDHEWENNIHEEGDPIMTIETVGPMVPWDNLDQLEADMEEPPTLLDRAPDKDEDEDIDEGGGMQTVDPDDVTPETNKDIFGRTHFPVTPHRKEDIPDPESEDPNSVPQKPAEIGGDELVVWIPRNPNIEHVWDTGEAITPMESWVEWNVQQRANQPRPRKDKADSHDNFESLCRIFDCEKIGEYSKSDSPPDGKSGEVERKGEEAFERGRYGGGHWDV